jgi:hypothetical protein
MTTAIRATSVAPIALGAAPGAGAPAGAPPLLPPPSSDAMPGDGMSMLYALMQKQREQNLDMGKHQVESRKQEKEIQMAAQAAAEQKAQEDAESAKKWGILGKIASVIAIAVSAVASVFSCGAATGLLIAASVLSTMAFVEGETHALGKLTGNEENSKWFTLGLGISSAICSGGAGLAATTTTVATKVLEVSAEASKITSEIVGSTVEGPAGAYIAMGFGAAGAITGGIGSMTNTAKVAGETFSKAAEIAKYTSAGVQLGNAATSAASTVMVSQLQADGIDAQADAKVAKQQMQRLDRLIQWVIDGVKETDGSHKRAMDSIQGAIQTQGQTLVTASSMRV